VINVQNSQKDLQMQIEMLFLKDDDYHLQYYHTDGDIHRY
jgi:hypothetical protein